MSISRIDLLHGFARDWVAEHVEDGVSVRRRRDLVVMPAFFDGQMYWPPVWFWWDEALGRYWAVRVFPSTPDYRPKVRRAFRSALDALEWGVTVDF